MFEIDKQKFGAFVTELRKEKGYTQKDLAQHLFISDKAISKWETAVSIPDTALLIPLANLLGVTVTELLMCERMECSDTMDAGKMESIVKTAISYSDEIQTRAYHAKSKWILIYGLSLLIGGVGMLLNYINGRITGSLITLVFLCVIFGAYFCFIVKLKLPTYYDENHIGVFHDGAFRMNVPGLSFNNTNWPYIVKVGRMWACLSMALFPAIELLMNKILPVVCWNIEKYVMLGLTLGGLFIPMYIVGKKYE